VRCLMYMYTNGLNSLHVAYTLDCTDTYSVVMLFHNGRQGQVICDLR
jgi:hypothetical protein